MSHLHHAGLAASGGDRAAGAKRGWTRVIVEKPFGYDLESARTLNRAIADVFAEDQVYRIDHYLGKETVQNLSVFRFGNGLFEPIWNRRYIDSVQITVAETVGVEGRGEFYDQTGAMRDVVQNHGLQLHGDVRDGAAGRVRARGPARREAQGASRRQADGAERRRARTSVRGQYVSGWVEGERITVVPRRARRSRPTPRPRPSSRSSSRSTPGAGRGCRSTCAPARRCPSRVTEIAVQFRRAPLALFDRAGVPQIDPNVLAIRIQPDEGILLRFGAKVPGQGLQIRNVNMDFRYGSSFAVDSPDAYETLLIDAMVGDASLFTRADEVERAWQILQPILDAVASGEGGPLHFYAAGTWGPPAADELLERDGRAWRKP